MARVNAESVQQLMLLLWHNQLAENGCFVTT